MAEEILDQDGLLYCLGDIVHNDGEVKRLTSKGLRVISHEQMRNLWDVKVLIRAHGEPPETYRLAMQNRIQLIDASCPVVLKLQNRIRKSFEAGEHILIYGKKDHAEVIGLQGQTRGEATVFQELNELNTQALPAQVTLYSQTTKSKKSFYEVTSKLREQGFEVKGHDTICRQVSHRDEELRTFANMFDRIVFVAGRKSSNGKMLYQVCRETNKQTYFVSETSEVHQEWFSPGDSIGICGATSTPLWLMEEIKYTLERL
ncbi:UNVERIFIED_CONTAM: hypothetical protein GTU68_026243 [Idotea baltica]|nr:hypothetical protein [Idotea baltica]